MGEFRTHSTSHRHRRGRQHRRRAPIPAATWPSDPETPGHIHSPVRRIADRRHRHQPGQHPAAATPTNPLPGQPPLPPIRPGHATPTRNPTQRCVNISTLAADPSHRHPPPPVAAPRPPSAKPAGHHRQLLDHPTIHLVGGSQRQFHESRTGEQHHSSDHVIGQPPLLPTDSRPVSTTTSESGCSTTAPNKPCRAASRPTPLMSAEPADVGGNQYRCR